MLLNPAIDLVVNFVEGLLGVVIHLVDELIDLVHGFLVFFYPALSLGVNIVNPFLKVVDAIWLQISIVIHVGGDFFDDLDWLLLSDRDGLFDNGPIILSDGLDFDIGKSRLLDPFDIDFKLESFLWEHLRDLFDLCADFLESLWVLLSKLVCFLFHLLGGLVDVLIELVYKVWVLLHELIGLLVELVHELCELVTKVVLSFASMVLLSLSTGHHDQSQSGNKVSSHSQTFFQFSFNYKS